MTSSVLCSDVCRIIQNGVARCVEAMRTPSAIEIRYICGIYSDTVVMPFEVGHEGEERITFD